MKTALVNLPYPTPVVRRYTCSYNSPGFLFPPLELLGLAAIVREWKRGDVALIDSIARRLDLDRLRAILTEIRPDLVLFLTGFEIFGDDMDRAGELSRALPYARFACLGYYPTLFPEEILARSPIHYVIRGEPELPFAALYDRLKEGRSPAGIEGLGYRENGEIHLGPPPARVEDLDALPLPARSLVDPRAYSEPLMPRPFTLVQSSRGCPFRCVYCVRTYGNRVVARSSGGVLDEISSVIEDLGIRSFRFIDDSFTIDRGRAIRISRGIVERGLRVEWSCLTRLDTLDAELLCEMRRAGCRRAVVGIESGSQRILDAYSKGYDVPRIREGLALLARSGMETAAFCMVGYPDESWEEARATVDLARAAKVDYLAVFRTIAYPGTDLFERLRPAIDFSLFPYKNELRDQKRAQIFDGWVRRMYMRFYLDPRYGARKAAALARRPGEALRACLRLFGFFLLPRRREKRKDFI